MSHWEGVKFLAALLLVPSLVLAGALERATPVQGSAITAAEASAIKTYTVKELAAKAPLLQGQIVKVRFLFMYNSPGVPVALRDQESPIYVRVPKEGLDWLSKIPTYGRTMSSQPRFAYARVETVGTGYEATHLAIFGKELKTDMKGASFSW